MIVEIRKFTEGDEFTEMNAGGGPPEDVQRVQSILESSPARHPNETKATKFEGYRLLIYQKRERER